MPYLHETNGTWIIHGDTRKITVYLQAKTLPTRPPSTCQINVSKWYDLSQAKRARELQQFVMQHSSCSRIKQAPRDTTKQLGTVDMTTHGEKSPSKTIREV